MDIFNRPPSISEDTLQYALYPSHNASDKISVATLGACIRQFVDQLLPDFIWHRDTFELKASEDSDTKAWFLEGRIRVGDCVDDEWCAVWLLREISSKWDLIISVHDFDGEFLLIEAAEELPPWVKPTNAENRVWIYKSRLHLIPLSHISPSSRKPRRRSRTDHNTDEDENNLDEEEDFLATEDAVKLVGDPNISTLAPAKVEATVWKRISRYPGALREHTHTTRAYVPVDVAKALLVNPSLVQKAVEAFYTRDAIQLRQLIQAAHRMSRFPPNTSVLRSVRMTRTSYAQLVGQKFFPPKIFGQWRENEGSKEYRWRDIGMKIAAGFEMLYQEGKNKSAPSEGISEKSKSEANKDALRRNPEYGRYVQNLISAGYFGRETEGSQLWNELETKAANAFIEIRSSLTNQRQSFARQVDLAVSEAASMGDSGLQEDDDDSWLNVDVEEFEATLEKTMGRSTAISDDAMAVDPPETLEDDQIASEQAARLKDLANKVEEFVEGEGDIEGARFEDEYLSDEPLTDSEDEQLEDSHQQSWVTNRAERSAAAQEAMNKLVPGLEPGDYGKMPPLHYSKSQQVAPATITTDVVEGAHYKQSEPPRKPPATRPTRSIREPILPRDKYEGVDSDDETDEENEDDESEEDKPQVVGDIEIDMGEEEEEFLEFSRQTLGISDEEWNKILQDRKGRGAFVPKSANKSASSGVPQTRALPKSAGTAALSGARREDRSLQPGTQPSANPELDSFEAVMNAMDVELSRLRTSREKGSPKVTKGEKGKEKVHIITEDDDIEAAMEAEVKAALDHGDEDELEDEDEPMDYHLIKNFLESFKSQAGLSGPVSNLVGRLQPEFKLPRDDM